MNKYDCTILINSCDKYEDILDTFFTLLHRFWPDNPFDIVLSTESLEYKSEYFKIRNIHPKNRDCSWTERIASALKEIKTNYVLFMLDDFFLYDYVKTDIILKNIEMLVKNDNIANFTYWPIMNQSEECEYSGFRRRLPGANYKVAAIAALWNKKNFLKYVDGYQENIWEFESKGTIRSNTLYPEDEFYISKDFPTQVIPYNFTKYGLFSGKWFKENKELEKKLGIKINYKKRGFYNVTQRGLTKSFISAFKIESYVIPKYGYTKDDPIHYHEIQKPGFFEQEYEIPGAKDIIYWSVTDQWGFAIKNLEIEVTYSDKMKKIVDNNNLFGNFKKFNKMLLFNKLNPCVYIPTEKNRTIEKVKIKGFLKVPIPKILTHLSYNRMKWAPKEYEQLRDDVNKESLLVNSIMSSITIKPEMYTITNGIKSSSLVEFEEKNTKDTFKYKFFIKDKQVDELEWKPSDYIGYSISHLKILYKVKGQKSKEFKRTSIKGLPKCINKQHVFLKDQTIKIKLPVKNIIEIHISGTIHCPIDKEIFAKAIKNEKR